MVRRGEDASRGTATSGRINLKQISCLAFGPSFGVAVLLSSILIYLTVSQWSGDTPCSYIDYMHSVNHACPFL